MKPFALFVVLFAGLLFTHCFPEDLLPGDGNGSEQLGPAQLGLLALGLQTPEEIVERPDPGPRGSPCMVKEEFSLPTLPEIYTETISGEDLGGYVTEPILITLGPDRPSVSVFAEHADSGYWTGASSPMRALWQAPDGTRFLNVESQTDHAWDSRSFLVSQIPLARNAEYAVGVDVYPHHASEQTYQLQFLTSIVTSGDIPVTGTAVYSCTPIPDQEKNYETDLTYDKENGQRHVWDDYAHLNIHIIFIEGVHELANAADFQPAMDRMTDLFLQSSAKIHLHFTTTTVNNPEFQYVSVDEIRDESGTVPGSMSYLFLNTAEAQKEDAVNLIITQIDQCCAVVGYAGNVPGPSGLIGTKSSAALLFINSEFSSFSGESGLRRAGRTMSHEIGHMLGLFHTDNSGEPDPLIETPYCELEGVYCFGENFSDSGSWNLLAGFASNGGRITGEQAYVMRLNPLLYRR